LVFGELKDPVREKVERDDWIVPLDPQHFFPTLARALDRTTGSPAPYGSGLSDHPNRVTNPRPSAETIAAYPMIDVSGDECS